MKIAFCSVAFREENITIEQIIKDVSDVGYKYIELWSNHLNDHELNATRGILEKLKVSVSMISPYFNFTGTDDEWKTSILNGEKVLGWATQLNCPVIRIFTGVVGSNNASSEQYEKCVKGIREIATMSDKEGIRLAIETHPRTLVDTLEGSKYLVNKIGKDNVGLNLDIYHLFEVDGNPVKIFENLKGMVFNIHAKNVKLSEGERKANPHLFLHGMQAKQKFVGISYMNDGNMDYAGFLREVFESGYDDCISVEWFGENPRQAAAHELNYLRRYIK